MSRVLTRARKHRRQGYLLLVTLFVIAIVGVMTVGFARLSINHAIETIESERDLQSIWGTASCERFAFNNRQHLLSEATWSDQQNKLVHSPIARSQCQIQLGSQSFFIRLDDENAKQNVNLILEETDVTRLKEVVRKFSKLDGLKLAPRPNEDFSRSPNDQPFESFGQLFAFSADHLNNYPDQLMSASDQITLWGNSVNYSVASDDIIYESAKAIVGATNASQLKRNRDRISLPEKIAQLPVDATRLEKMNRWFRPASTSQSVWVVNQTGIRKRHTLSVREEHTRTLFRISSFSW